uniref:30S RIBOSOMAL PROTEIN S4 n=1 Tax=Escherichia coli TaxID=562 RepID=UPI0000050FA6|nr:Chain D, 30s Ribosomal Protein S4 [Thermus thermophilus]1HR0_D Chain D, 30S RIBOSOMAL PROTEIN S4 [Thermus thermophilus]1JGO_G Chain G, 30S RIBOSOMAL PROTEIN S4 [Thermus thermophilus]1JGP_G Chain G, 30S RIBOSOMAL PROTEIN S4 [Thermus thermophilus]1JGQ_G Chain G, 30S RIBOSOMAL PROTEIN S4 [Thermus thermophilus]1ML5_G Chain G, 30S RIBOSOMAL PROTEIN S4 [Escherichia coli]2F4V_D Chain D, 30S ribosomal protein S4 [Thermus thermophilus]4V42_AG Chain AG, 30S RIBOSOMAL PROTEIN S4 [Thermus thermophilu
MGRYIGPVCRLCRREGVKLYLKGERCYSPKCAMERRPYPPGQHGQKRARRPSDYAVRLREKQKLRRIYGISERQFRNLFEEASKKKGVTGSVFLGLLESRLDNVVYRLGFAVSRRQARQLVRHGHITVNGRRVDLPSYRVRPGDEIAVAEKSRNLELIRQNLEAMKGRKVGPWLSLDVEGMKGKFLRLPDREDLALPVQENLVIEFYSR